MTSRSTPGPWVVVICDDGSEWSGWPLALEASKEADKTVVRPGGFFPYTWDAAVSQKEAVANACLMAASPDMRQALQAAISVLERVAKTGDATAIAAAELARAAIAKADNT